MSELNYNVLSENIKSVMKKNNVTQQQLADITGMSQANVSKALNINDKKTFTLEQVYKISEHFGISIDELVDNKFANLSSTSPRALLSLISKLLCDSCIRSTDIEIEEIVYEPLFDSRGCPSCTKSNQQIKYKAFYFPSYFNFDDFELSDEEMQDLHYEYCYIGNGTKYSSLNSVLIKLIPLIELYKKTEIPDEAFQMVLNGYLQQLADE